MIKNYMLLITFLATFLTNPLVFSQKNKGAVEQQVVNLEQDKISFLIVRPELSVSPDNSVGVAKFRTKVYWSKAKKGSAHLSWKVNAPKKEKYVVTLLAKSAPNTEYQIITPEETLTANSSNEAIWDRRKLGEVMIPAGESKFEFKAPKLTSQLEIKSIELIPSAEYPNHLKRLEEFRAAGAEAKFVENIYGIMHHWGNWSIDQEGNKKDFPQQFYDFDIEKYVDKVVKTGAAYVLWTSSWGEMYMAMPLKSVESIAPGRTTIKHGGRNFYLELAKALNKKGIKFMMYFHHGQGDARRHPGSTFWQDVQTKLCDGAEPVDDMSDAKKVYTANYKAILKEIGEQLGKRLYGWWFDDGGIDYPNDYHELSWNARAGNRNRLITYNNWQLAPYTEYQDYVAGEWIVDYKPEMIGEDGLVSSSRNRSFIPHSLVRVENHWAVFEKSPKIVEKETRIQGLGKSALKAYESGYAKTFNVMMHLDGSWAETTTKGLFNAKKIMEEAGHNRTFAPINQDLND